MHRSRKLRGTVMLGVRRPRTNKEMRDIESIVEDIESYNTDGDWLDLDGLVQELFAHPIDQIPTAPLFSIFERFPLSDGYGVFWSILHGLEDIPDCEPALLESLRRQPSLMSLTMARRILNTPRCAKLHSTVHKLAEELSTRKDLDSELVAELSKLSG